MGKVFVLLLAGGLLVLSVDSGRAQVSPESAAKYKEGGELFEKRRYREALQAFEAAVALDGKNAQAHRAIGRTCRELKDYDRASEAYRMAAEIKPDYAAAYYELGQMQLHVLRDYESAQASFRSALKIDPDLDGGRARTYLKAACVRQGKHDFSQRNFRRAAEQFERATQVDPSDAAAFFNLGLAHRYARRYREAEEAFTTATDLDPGYARAFKVLGDMYKESRRDSLAVRSYRRAIDADAKLIDAYLNLAAVYLDMDQPDRAVDTLKRAVAQRPDQSSTHSALGYAYTRQKKYQEAISSYEQALRLNGESPEVHYRLSVAYLEVGQHQRALSSAQKAFGSAFDIPAHVITGDAYEGMKSKGWKEKALAAYRVGLGDRRYQKYCEDKIDRILDPMAAGDE